jgi:hypothetical protein
VPALVVLDVAVVAVVRAGLLFGFVDDVVFCVSGQWRESVESSWGERVSPRAANTHKKKLTGG